MMERSGRMYADERLSGFRLQDVESTASSKVWEENSVQCEVLGRRYRKVFCCGRCSTSSARSALGF